MEEEEYTPEPGETGSEEEVMEEEEEEEEEEEVSPTTPSFSILSLSTLSLSLYLVDFPL